jgi:hypothetical protein
MYYLIYILLIFYIFYCLAFFIYDFFQKIVAANLINDQRKLVINQYCITTAYLLFPLSLYSRYFGFRKLIKLLCHIDIIKAASCLYHCLLQIL